MGPVPVKKMPAFIAHLLSVKWFLIFQRRIESFLNEGSTRNQLKLAEK
jgi:hypothetical protein